jgi:hypothetical protein
MLELCNSHDIHHLELMPQLPPLDSMWGQLLLGPAIWTQRLAFVDNMIELEEAVDLMPLGWCDDLHAEVS